MTPDVDHTSSMRSIPMEEEGSPAPLLTGNAASSIDDAAVPTSANNNGITTTSSDDERQGTISSARFNILCTMVGGGSLSLPLAFQKTGNGLLGPIFLLITAAITEYCFRVIVTSTRKLSPITPTTSRMVGSDTFEMLASAAFGSKGFFFAKGLVTAMCFFGAVGYAVLLRDMLQPITDAIAPDNKNTNSLGPSLASNMTMLTVVLFITPVCALQTLSALKDLGAASMGSILILGCCVVYRSLECNFGSYHHEADFHNWQAFHFFPKSAKDVLDAFPLFVSFFVCHYNIPAVHNELRDPTPKRVQWWLRSTTAAATLFYMVMGLAGSAYGKCTSTGIVQGNILLDFGEDDPLLLVARMCLAVTLTLAFPLLVVPARDILLRSFFDTKHDNTAQSTPTTSPATTEEALREPLLDNADGAGNNGEDDHVQIQALSDEPNNQDEEEGGSQVVEPADTQVVHHSFSLRLGTAILVLWTATAVACCVKSIDVVWDLLGSSLSILLSYLIPCGSYLVIAGNSGSDGDEDSQNASTSRLKRKMSLLMAWLLLGIYTPMMVVSTANAFYDTFFKKA